VATAGGSQQTSGDQRQRSGKVRCPVVVEGGIGRMRDGCHLSINLIYLLNKKSFNKMLNHDL